MSKIKVLVVDDESAIHRLLDHGLSGYGYEVTSASNGAETLATVRSVIPNIIILDVSLQSEPNGLDLCRQLREFT